MKNKKKSDTKKTNVKKIIIISAICLIVISIACYFILGNFVKFGFRNNNFNDNMRDFPKDFEGGENFQPINETTKNEITSFFGNSPSSYEIDEYCGNNLGYCMYYCRDINPEDEFCEDLMDDRMPQQGEPPQ